MTEVLLPRPISDEDINRALNEAADLPVTPEEDRDPGSPTNTVESDYVPLDAQPETPDAVIEEAVPLEGSPEAAADAGVLDAAAARQALYDEAEGAEEYVPTPEEIAAHENAQLPIQPITIVFNSTGLGIFVGRVLLEHALLNGGFGNEPGKRAILVKNGEEFAKNVGRALQAVNPDNGATLITEALDRAIQAVVDATVAEVPDTGLVVGDEIPLDDPETKSSIL